MEHRRSLATWPQPKKYRRMLVIVFLICSVLFGATMFLLVGLHGSFSHAAMPAILAAVLGGVIFGVAMTTYIAWMWQHSGGPKTAGRVQRAMKNRQLPSDIDVAKWARLLAKKESEALRNRWFYPVFFGVFTCLYILAGVTNAFPRLGALIWVGVAIVAGMGIYAPFDTERRLRAIRALIGQLTARVLQEP